MNSLQNSKERENDMKPTAPRKLDPNFRLLGMAAPQLPYML